MDTVSSPGLAQLLSVRLVGKQKDLESIPLQLFSLQMLWSVDTVLEPVWPSGKALGWLVSRRISNLFRFGSSVYFQKLSSVDTVL